MEKLLIRLEDGDKQLVNKPYKLYPFEELIATVKGRVVRNGTYSEHDPLEKGDVICFGAFGFFEVEIAVYE